MTIRDCVYQFGCGAFPVAYITVGILGDALFSRKKFESITGKDEWRLESLMWAVYASKYDFAPLVSKRWAMPCKVAVAVFPVVRHVCSETGLVRDIPWIVEMYFAYRDTKRNGLQGVVRMASALMTWAAVSIVRGDPKGKTTAGQASAWVIMGSSAVSCVSMLFLRKK